MDDVDLPSHIRAEYEDAGPRQLGQQYSGGKEGTEKCEPLNGPDQGQGELASGQQFNNQQQSLQGQQPQAQGLAASQVAVPQQQGQPISQQTIGATDLAPPVDQQFSNLAISSNGTDASSNGAIPVQAAVPISDNAIPSGTDGANAQAAGPTLRAEGDAPAGHENEGVLDHGATVTTKGHPCLAGTMSPWLQLM